MMSEGFLRHIERWQRAIASDLISRYPTLPLPQLNLLTQNFVISLLGLRLCEQFRLISLVQLRQLQQETDIYLRLQRLVQTVNADYGSLLPPLLPGVISDSLLSDILNTLEACWTGAIGIEILGQAYERCLSQFEVAGSQSLTHRPLTQKTGGSYYTPPVIVDDILCNTLDRSLQFPRFKLLTILDPACGGGAFLLAAYQRLLKSAAIQLSYEERRSRLLNCIFGVDIDAQAIAVTKLSLWLQLLIGESEPPASPLPDLTGNIHCGNALINFDWHQAFPTATQAEGFDVVVGNPPYIDSEWMTVMLPEWRRYCAAHYQTAVGNWDLFCVFIEKGLELCKSQGFLSFVVPNKLASAAYAAKVRSLLTCGNQLLAIHDYSRLPIFTVAVYPLVFVVQKGVSLPSSRIEYVLMNAVKKGSSASVASKQAASSSSARQRSHFFDYALYTCQPEKPWLIPAANSSGDWVTRLHQQCPPLAEIAQVTGAATVAEAYAMRSLLQEKPEIEPGDLQLVNSGTIDRYCLLWGKKTLRYLGSNYLHPVIARSQTHQLPQKRWQQASHPKIIVAGMTRGLECALDRTGGILAGKSTSVICSQLDLRYLLGILNSTLIRLYFVSHFGGNCLQGGYLRVGPPQLKQIPIRVPDLSDRQDCSLYSQMLELVDLRLSQPRSPEQLGVERQIDQFIYRLYSLTDLEIKEVEDWQRDEG